MKKKVEREKGGRYLKSLGPGLLCCSKLSACAPVSALPTRQPILFLTKPTTSEDIS